MLRNRKLLAVSVVVFATYTGIGMVVPVRVLYAQSHGASLAIIGAMASAYLISNFVFQYPAGAIADRWGRKRLMVAGIVAQAAITLVYLVVSDSVVFVLLRLLEGVAAAAILPPARALVAEAVAPESRGEAYGIFGAFFSAGFLLGPAIGGLLATTGYASAFIASVLVRLAAAAVVIVVIHDDRGLNLEARTRARTVPLGALFSLAMVAAYILAFGDYIWLGFDLTLFPLWMRHHLGASIAVIGLASAVWAVPSIVVSPIGGRLADRRRRSAFILVFGLVQIPFYVTYGVLNTAGPFLALLVIHSAIYSLVQPAVDAHLAAASPADARARAQSAYSTAGLAGAFISANVLSILYGMSFRLPFFVMSAAFGLCIVAGGTLVRISEARGLVSRSPEPLKAVESA